MRRATLCWARADSPRRYEAREDVCGRGWTCYCRPYTETCRQLRGVNGSRCHPRGDAGQPGATSASSAVPARPVIPRPSAVTSNRPAAWVRFTRKVAPWFRCAFLDNPHHR